MGKPILQRGEGLWETFRKTLCNLLCPKVLSITIIQCLVSFVFPHFAFFFLRMNDVSLDLKGILKR